MVSSHVPPTSLNLSLLMPASRMGVVQDGCSVRSERARPRLVKPGVANSRKVVLYSIGREPIRLKLELCFQRRDAEEARLLAVETRASGGGGGDRSLAQELLFAETEVATLFSTPDDGLLLQVRPALPLCDQQLQLMSRFEKRSRPLSRTLALNAAAAACQSWTERAIDGCARERLHCQVPRHLWSVHRNGATAP